MAGRAIVGVDLFPESDLAGIVGIAMTGVGTAREPPRAREGCEGDGSTGEERVPGEVRSEGHIPSARL